jgi:uncharacterized membrane protein
MARGRTSGPHQITTVERREEHLEHHTGPLPHPETLARYEATLPGAAERIITAMENEGAHRRELEKADAEHFRRAHMLQVRHQGRGQFFGLLVAFGGFGLAGFAIYCGHPLTAAAIAAIDLLGLVTVFVTGRGRSQKDEKSAEESKEVARPDK